MQMVLRYFNGFLPHLENFLTCPSIDGDPMALFLIHLHNSELTFSPKTRRALAGRERECVCVK